MKINIVLGNNIRKMREELNLRQEDLAELLEVSKSIIYSWERGTRWPSPKSLENLAKVFGIGESELFSRDELSCLEYLKTIPHKLLLNEIQRRLDSI